MPEEAKKKRIYSLVVVVSFHAFTARIRTRCSYVLELISHYCTRPLQNLLFFFGYWSIVAAFLHAFHSCFLLHAHTIFTIDYHKSISTSIHLDNFHFLHLPISISLARVYSD